MNENLINEISEEIDRKVNEIFLEFQEQLDIKSGDIAPLDALELDEIKERLADSIHKVLVSELEGCNG